MKRSKIILATVCLAILVTLCHTAGALSLITLRNGAEIKGEIVKQSDDRVFVDFGSDIVSVENSEILSIVEVTEENDEIPLAPVIEDQTAATMYRVGANGDTERSIPQIMADAMESVVIVSNPRGLGAGFVINKDGYVVTNHHVVRGEQYNTITAFLQQNGRTERKKFEDVELVSFSALFDIALLRISAEDLADVDLPPLPLATSYDLHVGDTVYAIGNPGIGVSVMSQTVSQGIASSVNRNLSDLLYIQTTAAVNPGNSGGPLLNPRGEVVGLVTLKASFQEGIAFALPVSYIRLFLDNQKSYALTRENPNMGYRYLKPE